MLIDWFTVIAQIINFLILLLLLRRFLYKPILNAMEERERKVTERLESARQERIKAKEERQRYETLYQELNQTLDEKKRQAAEEVETWRKQALHEARQGVEAAKESWRKALQQEQDAFNAELRQFAVRQSYAVAGKALRDLADDSLEARLLAQFSERLAGGKIDLGKFDSKDRLTVRSAFELSGEARKSLAESIQKGLGRKADLDYKVAPELGAGLELKSDEGHQVAWNLNRYLQTLEEGLSERLQSNQP